MQEELIPGLTLEESGSIRAEHEEMKRAKTYWSVTAILNLIFFYGLAFGIWGWAFGFSLLWSVIIGAVIGLAVAFSICSYPIFTKPQDIQQLKDMQFFVGIWVKLGIAIGVVGLIVLVVKILFFH